MYDYDLHYHHELISPKSTFISKGLSGLVNLGNKCFMSSILQCLSNTLKLTDYFVSLKYREDDPECLNKRKKEYYLVLSYLNLLVNIWDTNQLLKPKSFVENMSKFVGKYFTLEQQDSHECLMYILDILHRGLSYEIEVDINGKIENETDRLMEKSLQQWKSFYEKNYSFIAETFNGMFYNKINCLNCDTKQEVFEPFNCLSVDIAGFGNLNECLDNYFENVETINSWSCEKCKEKGCSKNVKCWNLPNYLIIHLKRFRNDGSKIDSHIDFPSGDGDLNLTKYVSHEKNDPNNYIYSLYAVNYHLGNAKAGHYISACQNLDKNWYLYNDGHVSKFHDNDNVLTKDAYVLFYYRKFIKSGERG
jgi:ubiquitin carboxyl-terminal hydrolase 8